MDDVCRMLHARRAELYRQITAIDIALRALGQPPPAAQRGLPAPTRVVPADHDGYRTTAQLARDAIVRAQQPLRIAEIAHAIKRTRAVSKSTLYTALHKASREGGCLVRLEHGLYSVPNVTYVLDPEVIDEDEGPAGASAGNIRGQGVVERRVAGGHLGEQHTEEIPLPQDIRRMVNNGTPPHLLTVRRGR